MFSCYGINVLMVKIREMSRVQFSVCYGSDAICTLPEILSLSSKVGREGWDRYFLGLSKETVLANNLQN